MKERILFYFDPETLLIWSRYGSELAVPVLDYATGNPDNNFEMGYSLERMPVVEAAAVSDFSTFPEIDPADLPDYIKNEHRKFWGVSSEES